MKQYIEKRIFTFWEPKENIPAYLDLCMKTWQKFLPEYEIIILDYSNLDEWLEKDFYPKFLYEKFTLPIQADAIRCAVLKKYGGLWLDVDTIITSSKITDLLNIDSQVVFINTHLAFIYAEQSAKIMNQWHNKIRTNLLNYEKYYNNDTSFLKKWFIGKYCSKYFNMWDFLGNYSLKKALKTKNKKYLFKWNRETIKALPEINYFNENNLKISVQENYQKFYFENNNSDYALKDNGGVILLHNSWTPEEYKQMTEDEFLSKNNTISNILKKVLF